MFKTKKTLVGVFLVCVMAHASACKSPHKPSGSDLKVTNSFVDDTGKFPYVVSLSYHSTGQVFCTATFIASDILLTAGHCVYQALLTKVSIEGSLVEIKDHLYHPGYIPSNKVSSTDLGAIQISESKSDSFASLSPVRVKKNQKVTMVGYGTNDYPGSTWWDDRATGEGTRRFGSNVWTGSRSRNLLAIKGVRYDQGNVPVGENVGIGKADSGSPLLSDDNKIIGVTSGAWLVMEGTIISKKTAVESFFAELLHRDNLEFLLELGEKFPIVRSTSCQCAAGRYKSIGFWPDKKLHVSNRDFSVGGVEGVACRILNSTYIDRNNDQYSFLNHCKNI